MVSGNRAGNGAGRAASAVGRTAFACPRLEIPGFIPSELKAWPASSPAEEKISDLSVSSSKQSKGRLEPGREIMSISRRQFRSARFAVSALLFLATLSFWGCSGHIANPPRSNIIMASKLGEPIDPATYKQFSKDTEKYDHYIDDIFSGLVRFCAKERYNQAEQGESKNSCRMLMFFHGGLNTNKAAVQRAVDLSEKIETSHYYPLFVNWRSSLLSTWWGHLAHVHKGIYFRYEMLPFVPYVVVVDEVKSIIRAPEAWVAEARHAIAPQEAAGFGALAGYQDLVHNKAIDVNDLLNKPQSSEKILIDDRSPADRWLPRTSLVLTLVPKILTPPLLVQSAGTGAWDVLERRTTLLFRTEAEFRGVQAKTVKKERQEKEEGNSSEIGNGDQLPNKNASNGTKTVEEKATQTAQIYDTGAALAHFLKRYQDKFLPQFCEKGDYDPALNRPDNDPVSVPPPPEPCKYPIDITLVGHSMGAIVIDQLLRYEPDLKVKNIVFMAAATTVEDYRDTVNPYLANHPETQMYHLILHPLAEVSERNFLDLTPRGSLLVWIDNYFTDPPTPLGRRVGRFANLIPELTFADSKIKRQLHLKVFRVGGDLRCTSPQKHGDFGSFPFWDEKFWNPQIDSTEGSPIKRLDC